MTPLHPNSVSRRQFLQITGGAASLLLLGGCVPAAPGVQAPVAENATPAAHADTPQRGGVLRMAPPDTLTTLDGGFNALSAADVYLGFIIYNRLARRSEGEEGAPLYPQLAESWELSEDGLIWTFHLRQGVTFHHGTPFTAKDVAHSINRIADPAGGATLSANLSFVDHVESVDDYTVRVHMKTPNVAAPYLFASYINIVPHDRTNEQLAQEPTGTGPFQLAEYTPGERVVLKRNEQYWEQGLPYLDAVEMLFIPEPVSQIAALTSGTIDLVMQVGVENVPQLESNPDLQVLESRQRFFHVFNMLVTMKPFDDQRVRQAFKHAIDRPALHQLILQGRGEIGNDQPIGVNSPFWVDIPPLAYDVEKAKQLLAEAGYADGLAVTLTVADTSPRVVDAAVAIQGMVKAAGIIITLEKTPIDTFWTEKYMQTPFFNSWWPSISEPEGILPLAYASGAFYNESGWSDPKVDALIQQARGERDLDTRKQLYAEAQQIISEQGAVLIPYFMPFLQATHRKVKGVIAAEVLTPEYFWLAQA